MGQVPFRLNIYAYPLYEPNALAVASTQLRAVHRHFPVVVPDAAAAMGRIADVD